MKYKQFGPESALRKLPAISLSLKFIVFGKHPWTYHSHAEHSASREQQTIRLSWCLPGTAGAAETLRQVMYECMGGITALNSDNRCRESWWLQAMLINLGNVLKVIGVPWWNGLRVSCLLSYNAMVMCWFCSLYQYILSHLRHTSLVIRDDI